MTDLERRRRIEELCDAALDRDPAERATFVAAACGRDEALRHEVEALLAHAQRAEAFLAEPMGAVAAQVLADASGASLVGRQIGSYTILSLLGAGGMGEVYRARDAKLGRDVAIKVVADAFLADPERRARFDREARVLATLNHPHIGAIYGLEDADGVRGLVLELVEGPTLAERLERGPIPVSEALILARQIAEALEAAHEKGIIHRDLKPGNVKVTPDGTVKVLDFGLAKAVEAVAATSADVAPSPTITTPAMTREGVILGTAAYMSPEQARGRTVDRRTDIWAFGAVLYEMLTGRRAFPGDDVSEVVASVLAREPDWARLPATLPLTLGTYLRRCLHKDPRQRIHDIADMRLALEGAFETAPPQTTASTASRHRLVWMSAFAVALITATGLAIPAVRHLRETPPPAPPETRTEIVTPGTDDPIALFALSPDGRQIVFVASGDGGSRLWLRSLATTTAQPLPGTDGARNPFWAPDGRSLGFFAGNALKRLDLGGGAPKTLVPVNAFFGLIGTWNADGVIVFTPGVSGPLMRVSATGGAATAVTTLGPKQNAHHAPSFLPDGHRFLFWAQGGPDTTGIYLGALDGSAPTRLTPAGVNAPQYLPTGWLFWRRADALVAQRLDLTKAALTGEPVTVADSVGAFSVAATGLVAYRTTAGSQRQLTWVDRSGTARGTVGAPEGNDLTTPSVSPDGRRVAVTRTVLGNSDIWLLDGARTSRLTFDAALDRWPIWSPDGSQIVFYSNRTSTGDLYYKLTSAAGAEERLLTSGQPLVPTSWSADGRFLLYLSSDPQTLLDMWVLPMTGARTPAVFLKTPFSERSGVFSPDGRWVAYMSNESGQYEIYVRPFVPPDAAGTTAGVARGQWLVSAAGGVFPLWRPDGKELFYLNPAGAMMAAPIAVTGSSFESGAPIVLFPTRIHGGGADTIAGRAYDVAPDGRFLINTELGSVVTPITLLMNWQPDANK